MKVYNYISVDSIIDEYLDLSGTNSNIDKKYIKRLADKLVRRVTYKDQLTHKVVLLDVSDYTAKLPSDLSKVVQVAYKGIDGVKCRYTDVVEWLDKDTDGCVIKYTKDCDDCGDGITIDVDRQFLAGHPELFYGNNSWYRRTVGLDSDRCVYSTYYPEFKVIPYSGHTMFGIDYHIKKCSNLSDVVKDSPVGYTIEDGLTIRLNVKNGQLLVGYLAYNVDKNGFRLVPDDEDLIDAIKWYVEEMVLYREARKTGDRSILSLSERARQLKNKSIGRASEKMKTMDFQDFWSFMTNNILKLDDYNSFFNEFSRTKRSYYTRRF